MTGDQLAFVDLDVVQVVDVLAFLDDDCTRLWHFGDLGSARRSCMWRPVQTIVLPAESAL